MIPDIKYKKRKLGSYPYFLVLFSLIFALTIIGLWGTVLIIGDQLQQAVKERITVQVYLHNELEPDSIASIKKAVSARPYILRKGGQARVEFISKEASAKKFIEETGENFASLLGDNPLRDAMILHIDPAFSHSGQLSKIKEDLISQPGIFEVVYTENLAEAIHKNIQKFVWAAIGFTAAMSLVILILITNTIRLAMYSQRFLIRSMQLVGARNWFIQKPYLFRSLGIGFVGGIISSSLILLGLQYSKLYFPEIEFYLFKEYMIILLAGIILGGAVLCFISSFFAVNRFLGKRLEDLY